MNKTIFFNFLKDKSVVGLIYLLNTGLIVFFYWLLYSDKVHYYPILISFFLLLILLLIEWTRYYRFNKDVNNLVHDKNYIIRASTCEQIQMQRMFYSAIDDNKTRISSLEAENENRIRLLSQWIHNLKTPISVIDLIVQKCKADAQVDRKEIENINQENESLYASIEQILSVIRLENMEKDYELTKVDLHSEIRKIVNIKKNQFIYNNLLPVLDESQQKDSVITDRKWNQLMLEQIISNAIKYSGNSEQQRKVYFKISTNGAYTYLSIRDQGIGIPDYDLNRVFEPFFTGENGRTHRGSTGIGLYICSEVAKKLSHTLEIKSEIHKGTEVIIRYLSKL